MRVKERKPGKRGKRGNTQCSAEEATPLEEESLLTSHQVSELLGVDPSSINNWVRGGRLPSFKTPGGHNRIQVRVLCEFLRANNMAIPTTLSHLSRRRLLIVDDDAQELRRWKRKLAKHSGAIDFLLVESGIEALVQVGAFRPHVVVLDVVMPEVDGLAVCSRLQSMPDMQDVRLVVVSAELSPEIVERASEAGATAAWAKPISTEKILHQLGLSTASRASP